jgi:hypothetical protein
VLTKRIKGFTREWKLKTFAQMKISPYIWRLAAIIHFRNIHTFGIKTSVNQIELILGGSHAAVYNIEARYLILPQALHAAR